MKPGGFHLLKKKSYPKNQYSSWGGRPGASPQTASVKGPAKSPQVSTGPHQISSLRVSFRDLCDQSVVPWNARMCIQSPLHFVVSKRVLGHILAKLFFAGVCTRSNHQENMFLFFVVVFGETNTMEP